MNSGTRTSERPSAADPLDERILPEACRSHWRSPELKRRDLWRRRFLIVLLVAGLGGLLAGAIELAFWAFARSGFTADAVFVVATMLYGLILPFLIIGALIGLGDGEVRWLAWLRTAVFARRQRAAAGRVPDDQISACALAMIGRHGDGAFATASELAERCAWRGDHGATLVWRRVADAVAAVPRGACPASPGRQHCRSLRSASGST